MPSNQTLELEQAIRLATMLTEALESIIYTYDKGVTVDEEYVEACRRITLGSKELLGL